ncbi:hypothetical protein H7H82_04270 [Mycobacterium heidelbergense]|uniref:Uncharacterized protein n=1 Tax=Mycobacterium heidelbergense TaxID=53376 RepID=A0A1X0DVZ1_MYCHE|nr:hypothetical protein [Mycobacterium heidelbergense]MCV7049827.1 hypothetical protein [Mycobacterium heidelbergense]ORA75950.1 hypothetical protein BST25_02880 [Mycobacterium heidelbergense]BBZ52294.1 hypothetical protein MHEI_40110 [Mycobacterium heidelbergense]
MWSDAAKGLAKFDEAMVTALDPAGYPVSIRQMTPCYDEATGEFTVVWPRGLSVSAGPAIVLCHSHDEKLWNIKQIQIKGRLERRADRWVFITTGFHRPPASQLGVFWRLARDMRRAGRRYLDQRGLEAPTVNWKALQVLRDRASAKSSSRLL